MKHFIFILFIASPLYAGTVDFCGQTIQYDDSLSLGRVKDWSKLTENDLNGKTIYAINIQADKPDTHVFPDKMTGVIFANPNIDNVFLPPGNQVILCNHDAPKRVLTLEDGCDWVLDKDNNPLETIDPNCGLIQTNPPPPPSGMCPC